MVWSEGNMSVKNPVIPLGIDPGTVLNHYATPTYYLIHKDKVFINLTAPYKYRNLFNVELD